MTSAVPLRGTVTDARKWVMDTSTYTHLCRAGHSDLIKWLAPSGVVVIPTDVDAEIQRGRENFPGIPAVSAVDWAEIAILTDDEILTQAQIKAELGGTSAEHLGECVRGDRLCFPPRLGHDTGRTRSRGASREAACPCPRHDVDRCRSVQGGLRPRPLQTFSRCADVRASWQV